MQLHQDSLKSSGLGVGMAETHREYPGHSGSPQGHAKGGSGQHGGGGPPWEGHGEHRGSPVLPGLWPEGPGCPGDAPGALLIRAEPPLCSRRLRRPSGVSRVSVATSAGRSSALPLPKCPGRRGRAGAGAGCSAAAAAAPRPVSGPAGRHRRHRGAGPDRSSLCLRAASAGTERSGRGESAALR